MRKLVAFFAAVALFASGIDGAHAQSRLGLYGGVGEYDLSGVDQATVTALRGSIGITRFLAIEAGASYARVEQSFADTKLYMPDLQAQLRVPVGPVTPYAGIGGGLGIEVPEDAQFESTTEATLSVALGALVDLPYRLGVAVDGRLRNYGKPFTASGAEATFGIGYRF